MERREHRRLYTSLPMEYQVQLKNSADSWSSQATLKNISLGGLYFECETLPQLKRGHIADFTFKTLPAQADSYIASHIKATALVKRIEHRVAGSPNFGVAVEFLTGPLFA